MQLNMTTDYAIRIVSYLGEHRRIVPSTELSKELNISKTYVLKMMRNLVDDGIVNQHRGVNGGYSIAKKPSEISILDIFHAMENTIQINRCLEADHYCNRNLTPICIVHRYYKNFQNIFNDYFDSITIQNILDDQNDLLKKVRKKASIASNTEASGDQVIESKQDTE